jgi:hypothetical protein
VRGFLIILKEKKWNLKISLEWYWYYNDLCCIEDNIPLRFQIGLIEEVELILFSGFY